jgi:small subunit ribosomal protein S2
MLTNWSTIQKRIERLRALEKQEALGAFETLSKKEYSEIRLSLKKVVNAG